MGTSLNISSSTAPATFGLSFTSSASVCLLRMHALDGRRSRQFLAFPQSTFPTWKRLATSLCSPWVQFMSLSQCFVCSGPNLGERSRAFNQPTQVSFLDEQSQWQKVVPAPNRDLPKRYHSKAIHVGYVMTIAIACIYVSFPVYTHAWPMKPGNFLLEPPSA